MEEDKFDELLDKIFHDESFRLKEIDEITVPDINAHLKKFEHTLLHLKPSSGNGKNIRKRLLGAACIISFSLILSFLYEVPPVNALKLSIINSIINEKSDSITINSSYRPSMENRAGKPPDDEDLEVKVINMSIEEAMERLPFHMIVPEYLPYGYKFSQLNYYIFPVGDDHAVTISYANDSGGYLLIRQRYIAGEFSESRNIRKTDRTRIVKMSVMGTEAIVVTSPEICSAHWFKDKVEYEISATIPEAEFFKLLESIK